MPTKPDPLTLWREAVDLDTRAEKLRQQALTAALPAAGWRLKAVADAFGVRHTSLRRLLERMPPLLARYNEHRFSGRPPAPLDAK